MPGKRWIMTRKQLDFIYALALYIVEKLKDPDRRVYFDVDGVLRDIVAYYDTDDDSWGSLVAGKSIYELITEDFSQLEEMPDTVFVPSVQQFTDSPYILSTQIELPAQDATMRWLARRFASPHAIFVGEGSYNSKNMILEKNDRIFDDHPKFPESNKLIIVGHGYNKDKPGFRVDTVAEMEGALDVLQPW